ncbi:hypothetical protein GC101_10550 [Paenibacillus sp. LMG 31459]|uniref:Uncharacterized protein n=1 Tax=Paenibacillus phytohabitans TaxID=2654978 RepID=A0ABX1YEB1_9BACL|nr:hypothetical protein [Paenibacillus phytohabitans]NOU79320.1 hypothetical protein [Paenibacillus phytohabitans]
MSYRSLPQRQRGTGFTDIQESTGSSCGRSAAGSVANRRAPGAPASGRTSAAADPRAAGDQSTWRDCCRGLAGGLVDPGELSIDAPAVAR